MQLDITPARGPADSPLFVVVRDAQPGEKISLTAAAEDRTGVKWSCSAEFEADAKGRAELVRHAPVGNTPYAGVDPMGMILSMVPENPEQDQVFHAPWNSFTAEFEARAGTETLKQAVVREIGGPGTTRTEIDDPDVCGVLFEPEGDGPCPGIVLCPCGEDMEPVAGLLASRGYAVLCPSLPAGEAEPREVPLESWAAAVVHLDEHPRTAGGPVNILAGGFGAEGAAAMCSYIDVRLACLILMSPSSVVWRAERGDGETSRWTLDDRPLPFLSPGSMMGRRMLSGFRRIMGGATGPTATRQAYEAALNAESRAEAARIPVEEIEAPILLMAGRTDPFMPSPEMARAIKDRRKEASVGGGDRMAFFDLGHMVPRIPGLPAEDAGSPEIAKAWSGLLTFLRDCSKQR